MTQARGPIQKDGPQTIQTPFKVSRKAGAGMVCSCYNQMLEILKKDNGKETPITISISRVGFDLEIPTLVSVQLLQCSMTYMQSILGHLLKAKP